MEGQGFLETGGAAPWLIGMLENTVIKVRHTNTSCVEPMVADLTKDGFLIRAHRLGTAPTWMFHSSGSRVDLDISG